MLSSSTAIAQLQPTAVSAADTAAGDQGAATEVFIGSNGFRENGTLRHVPVDSLDVSHNVRSRTDPDLFEALIRSVRDAGQIIQPGIAVQVLTAEGAPRYRLVAGHRRFAAAVANRFETFPVLLAPATLTDAEVLAWALAENENREELSPMDQARQFKALVDLGWTQSRIASFLGLKNNGRVSEYLKLLDLPEEVQERVANGTLSAKSALRGRVKSAKRKGLAEPVIDPAAKSVVVFTWTDTDTGLTVRVYGPTNRPVEPPRTHDALVKATKYARYQAEGAPPTR